MLIAARDISKSYTEKKLLVECSFFIKEKEKIGIVGLNGAGKSTLLKLLAQAESIDGGTITMQNGVRIGYLPQNPILNDHASVLEQVMAGGSNEQQEYEAKTILHKLGILSLEEKVGNLSGGQKKRVALASVLIASYDVLILDEPTNHLDNDMIIWLENYLIKYSGAVVMVTHDRYFLDRIVTQIVEVSQGSLYFYEGNYSKYLELKLLREEMEIATERKQKSLFRKELEWIRRGVRARGTKSKSRIERFENLKERISSESREKFELDSVSTRLGKTTIEIKSLSKNFGEKQVLCDFSHIFARDARIGIVGKNGAGKSTLLNLISGKLSPTKGEIIVGDTVKIAHFTQEYENMDLSLRVIDYVRSFGETVATVQGTRTATQMLDQFLFSPDLQWSTIGRLSGGEKRRLYLLTLVMNAPNILLLDEPTNDLDTETLMVLEDYLEGFKGAVIVVSHDRYFLDKVTNLIFEIQEDGTVQKYMGSYSEYLENKKELVKKITAVPEKVKPSSPKIQEKAKFSFNEQREYEIIDDQIAELEADLLQVEKEMLAETDNYELLQTLVSRKTEIENELNQKMERWLYLNQIAEKMKV